jgi:hypothetical protein
MHALVSWDIKSEGDEWNRINEAMRECLRGYSWVKPLSTFYIVQIDDATDRADLKDDLVSVCKQNPGKVHFVISPALTGDSYSGWLPKTLWPKIKQRTQ